MAKKRRVGVKEKQSGGYLVGPSHEEGGILAQAEGQDPVELEGGEYIINAATTEALGIDFLDKLNRTASPYHSAPGFNRGQLPGSNYKSGGYVKKLEHGGRYEGDRQQRKNVSLGNLPNSYRETNVNGKHCSNCNFFRAKFCKKWSYHVHPSYICDAWEGDKIIKSGDMR